MAGSSVSLPCNTFECRSAILVCFRMNARSPGVTVKPWPTTGGAAPAGVATVMMPTAIAINKLAVLRGTSTCSLQQASRHRKGPTQDFREVDKPRCGPRLGARPASRIPYLGERCHHGPRKRSFHPGFGERAIPRYGEPQPCALPEYAYGDVPANNFAFGRFAQPCPAIPLP